MKYALALALLTAFTGFAHAGPNPYGLHVNQQYVAKPLPGHGPCINCGGLTLKQNPGEIVVNPAQKFTPNATGKVITR